MMPGTCQATAADGAACNTTTGPNCMGRDVRQRHLQSQRSVELQVAARRYTPTRRICRRDVGVNGIAYSPEKQAWQKLFGGWPVAAPTAASIPSSDK